jgi:hypothetical protein
VTSRDASAEPIEIRAAAGRKQPIHFGAPGRPLFGFYHPPKEGLWRGAGVVLCNPIGTDQTRSDRTYRHLAERLSAVGFACLRFDLFSTGDSGGDEFFPGIVRAWVDDVVSPSMSFARVREPEASRSSACGSARRSHSCTPPSAATWILWCCGTRASLARPS